MTDKPAKKPKPLSPQDELFCRIYARQPINARNVNNAYAKSRDVSKSKPVTWQANARRLLQRPAIKAKIRQLEIDDPPGIAVGEEVERALSPQEEVFCARYILNNKNATEAYLRAYPEARELAVTSQWEAASRLRNDSKVSARILELEKLVGEVAKERYATDVETLLGELLPAAYGSIDNAFDIIDGNVVFNPAKMTSEQWKSIQEISYDAKGNPRIKMHPKVSAIDALVKAAGGYAKHNEQRGKAIGEGVAKALTPTELTRWLMFKFRQAAKANREKEPGGGSGTTS